MSKETSLKRFLNEDNFQWALMLCCQLIFIGFVCSRAMVSIGMIVLLVIAVLHNGLSQTFQKYFQRKEYWILSFFFLIVFVSGIYSEDKSDWLIWVRIKLPYLALPLAFAETKKFEQKKFILILYGFILTLFISVVAVLTNYFLHYQIITDSFLRGKAIPMPFSHIRYTLMVTFSFFCCWFLFEKEKYFLSTNEKWLQFFLMAFLFIALHILSVRSALLALYLGLFFLILRFTFVKRKFVLAVSSLFGLTAFLFIADKFIPSLQNKFEYMQYDRSQFEKGEVKHLSDGVRIISMKGGLEIAKENLWFGVGAGDLKTELEKFYTRYFPQLSAEDRKPIHNQFIWTLASTGAIGLSVFLFAFFFPLFANGNYKSWIFVVLHLILFSSFFTEATLEEQMGTGFYLIFLLLFMNQFKKE